MSLENYVVVSSDSMPLDVALMAPMIANLADDVSEIGLRMGIGFTLAGKV